MVVSCLIYVTGFKKTSINQPANSNFQDHKAQKILLTLKQCIRHSSKILCIDNCYCTSCTTNVTNLANAFQPANLFIAICVFQTNTSSVTKQQMTRNDVSKNVIEIVHSDGTNQTINRFLITKKTLDASDISVKVRGHVIRDDM